MKNCRLVHIAHVPRSLVLTRRVGRVAGVWAPDDGICEGLFGDIWAWGCRRCVRHSPSQW